MSYYLDTYEFWILFPCSIVCFFVLLAGFNYLAGVVEKRFALKKRYTNALVTVPILLAAVGFFLLLTNVPNYLNDGQITRVYLVAEDEPRLVVWFTRVDTPAGISTSYAHRIKSFDLVTGAQRGRLTLSSRAPFNDYRIHGPFGSHAWGYSEETGLRYLDLYNAQVVIDRDEILRRNPVLGDEIKLVTNGRTKPFDPVTHGAYVYVATGEIYRIDPDLKATAKRDIDYSSEKHDKEYCLVCQHDAQFERIVDNTSCWTFDGDSESTLVFKDETGKELNRLDLPARFGEGAALLTAVTVKGELLLLVTRKRYTLSALRTDPRTGEVLGQTDIF